MAEQDPAFTARLDQLVARLAAIVDEVGWAMTGVGAGEAAPGFAYSVGLALRGWPELVIVSMAPEVAHDVLWSVVELDRPVRTGERLAVLRDGYELAVGDVHPAFAASCMGFTTRVLGQPFEARQLIWPDPGGCYPGEEGWAYPGSQPLLATEEAVAPFATPD